MTELNLTEVSEQLNNLKSAAQDLNKSSDALGNTVNEIDKFIGGLNLGCEAWVLINPGATDAACKLGYGKYAGRWGLLISRESDTIVDDVWLFNDAPRRLRVDMIVAIPSLLEALLRVTKDTLSAAQAANVQAQDMLGALRR